MPKPKVLVIEDDPTIQMLLNGALSIDCEVKTVGRGDHALAAITQEPPDIILLDVGLPDMTGFEICRQIKAKPAFAKTPVIFLTSHDEADKELRGLEAGGIDYLAKPVNILLLRARIKNHIAAIQAKSK